MKEGLNMKAVARFKITVYEDRKPVYGKVFVLEEGRVRAIDCDKDGHIGVLIELEAIHK